MVELREEHQAAAKDLAQRLEELQADLEAERARRAGGERENGEREAEAERREAALASDAERLRDELAAADTQNAYEWIRSLLASHLSYRSALAQQLTELRAMLTRAGA